MSNKLIQLPKFSYTDLDFDTIIADTKALIKEHPEYAEHWDDFLESNAGRMLIEVIAYIIEKNTSKVDWIAREMFISTATQRQSLINILKLINYRPQLPKAARVGMKLKLTKWAPEFTLNAGEKVTGINSEGNPVTFELLDYDDDGKPNYSYSYTLQTGDRANPTVEFYNVPFYQGKTINENDVYLDGVSNEKVTLDMFPVIENTIRVSSMSRGLEFPEVDSFISTEAQQVGVPESQQAPPYLVEIDDQNRATIVFGPDALVKIPSKGERLSITYRIGGGASTNVVSGAINQTKTYTSGDHRVSILYSNPDPGSGGADQERVEDAKLTAPLTLRSANKTVTHEDYVTHLVTDSSIMKANVVGKENEPDEIFEEYGYNLPPLDTWIYVVPQLVGWESINPYELNQRMLISRPYDRHDSVDEEEITISALSQSVYMKKYKKYKGFAMYVTLHENSPENNDWLAADSYIEGTDYTIDPITATFTRIQSSDGGTIPAGERTLKIRYIYDTIRDNEGVIDQENSVLQFKNNTVHTFQVSGTSEIITLDTTSNSLYPNYPLTITDVEGSTVYELDTDYEINWSSNVITRKTDGTIGPGEKVIVTFANHWAQDENDVSGEKNILDIISDKKMICVDNHVKDSLFSPFDVKGVVYCYKNMRRKVQDGLENYLRQFYTLEQSSYNDSILKADLINKIMNYSGVRFVEVEYLGKDYEAYRRYVLDEITLSEMQELGGQNVEHKIDAKYNEILVLANDEYEGTEIVENKRHGLIFEYKDA